MRSLWKKQVPAFLLALVMLLSLAPMADAAETSGATVKDGVITYRVEAGKKVFLDEADFAKLHSPYSETDYLWFQSAVGLDQLGHFEAKGRDSKDRPMDKTIFEDDLPAYFICNMDSMGSYDYELNTTAFVANAGTNGNTLTIPFTFRTVGSSKDRHGTLKIEIGQGNGGNSGSASGTDLSYKMDENDVLEFSAKELRDLYTKESNAHSSAFKYLEITRARNLEDYGHFTARNKKGDLVKLETEKNLDSLWFFYNATNIGMDSDCDLNTLEFVSDRGVKGTLSLDYRLVGEDKPDVVTGTMEIAIGGTSSGGHVSKADLVYKLDNDDYVTLRARDFRDYYDDNTSSKASRFSHVTFTRARDLEDYGRFTADDRSGKPQEFHLEKELVGVDFYYDPNAIRFSVDCDLNTLRFDSYKRVNDVLAMDFTAVGEDKNDTVTGTVEFLIGDVQLAEEADKPFTGKGDLTYNVVPGDVTSVDANDFNLFYQSTYTEPLRYVEFTKIYGLTPSNGQFFLNYAAHGTRRMDAGDLVGSHFYFADEFYGDFALADLDFVAAKTFKGPVALEFEAHGSASRSVKGTVVFTAGGGSFTVNGSGADIRYQSSGLAPVKLNPADVVRFYTSKFPGAALQSLRLGGVPAEGVMVYNYNNRSVPGSSSQLIITASGVSGMNFSYNPVSYTEYAMNELYYAPSRVNTCAAIPFAATGTAGTATGTIYISVTANPMPAVYGTFIKNAPVAFPAASVFSQVQRATGLSLAGIRFLELPPAAKGTLMMKSGTLNLPVALESVFSYSAGSWRMNQITFVPAANFTGSVDLPYAAYDSTGKIFATGVVSLGITNQQKVTFKDINTGTWCYRYVTELTDAGIISGYKDGTFKEKNTLTWGAALKLICLANNTGKQGDSFETFLSLAQARGWVTGTVNLKKGITRQEFCQVAARAMGLTTVNNPKTSPFSDTSDPYVLALSTAGIIGGYENGTFQPNRLLTRGHISAIIWRMNQYK